MQLLGDIVARETRVCWVQPQRAHMGIDLKVETFVPCPRDMRHVHDYKARVTVDKLY